MSVQRLIMGRFGGGQIEVLPTPPPNFDQPVCLFVHGYNAVGEDAVAQLKRLRLTIEHMKLRVPDLLATQTWAVLWPGFAQVGFRVQTWSPLTYPAHIRTAREGGRALAEYLQLHASPGKSRITLLAHSLGCRLVLEALQHLNGWRDAFPMVVLMAAAVPLGLLWNGMPLHVAASLPRRTFVLYSGRDDVLQAPFMLGQTAALDGGFLPEAVGATGAPRLLWTKLLETSNDHSSYFDDDASAGIVVHSMGGAAPLEKLWRDTPVRNQYVARSLDVRSLAELPKP